MKLACAWLVACTAPDPAIEVVRTGDALRVRAGDLAIDAVLDADALHVGELVLHAGSNGWSSPREDAAVSPEILPLHLHARAWMPETRALFVLAARAGGLGDDPAAWPSLATADDLDPHGMIAGDTPGFGMTCATTIRCPGDAPICVTADHAHDRGFCTRACLSDDECGDGGRCGYAIADIPGVPGGLAGCYVPCGADVCPALLACGADGVCAPP